jgi:lipase
MPVISAEGITAHYRESGAGPPVVLLHAGGSSGAQWRKAGAFLEDDFRLIAPDLIGFGETDIWPEPATLSHDRQARLVREMLDHLCDGPVHLVGHSYGGSTAVRLFLAAPDRAARLVLIEPNLAPLLKQAGETELFEEYRDLAETFIADAELGQGERAWKRFIDYRNGPGTWETLSEAARDRMLAQTTQTTAAYYSNLNNPTTLDDIRSITRPTLVLCGAKTTAPDRCITEILRDTLPDCKYETIPEAGHMSPLTHAEPVARAIRRHLS